MTKFVKMLVLAMTLTSALSLPGAARSDTYYLSGNTYAAIAYSPSTGDYGFGYNFGTRAGAEQRALKDCNGDDAQIVTWVNNGFCALALGDDQSRWGYGYSWGGGASNVEAKQRALKQCQSRTTGAHIVLCISSLDIEPEIYE